MRFSAGFGDDTYELECVAVSDDDFWEDVEGDSVMIRVTEQGISTEDEVNCIG